MGTTGVVKAHPFRSALVMMFNPGEILKHQMAHIPWPFSLAVSMTAFMLFFLQTGLDLLRTGRKELSFVLLLVLAGALMGSLGVGLLAGLAWSLSKMFRGGKSFSWAVSAFGLSYSSSLVYGLTGLITALAFNWNTAIAFGATGVLWATSPVISTVKEMVNGKTGISVFIATLTSSLLLCGWSLLGNL